MKKIQFPAWEMMLPDDWEYEEEDESVVLFHPEGPGVLQISAGKYQDQVSEQDLAEMAHEHLEAGAIPQNVELGDFDGMEINYSDDEQYWREWYLGCDNVMLFITYNCNIEDEEQEDVIIDAILETLAINEE